MARLSFLRCEHYRLVASSVVLYGPGTVKPVALFMTVGPTVSMRPFYGDVIPAALYTSIWSIWLSDTVRTGESLSPTYTPRAEVHTQETEG
jgi:hypothetical protein